MNKTNPLFRYKRRGEKIKDKEGNDQIFHVWLRWWEGMKRENGGIVFLLGPQFCVSPQ